MPGEDAGTSSGAGRLGIGRRRVGTQEQDQVADEHRGADSAVAAERPGHRGWSGGTASTSPASSAAPGGRIAPGDEEAVHTPARPTGSRRLQRQSWRPRRARTTRRAVGLEVAAYSTPREDGERPAEDLNRRDRDQLVSSQCAQLMTLQNRRVAHGGGEDQDQDEAGHARVQRLRRRRAGSIDGSRPRRHYRTPGRRVNATPARLASGSWRGQGRSVVDEGKCGPPLAIMPPPWDRTPPRGCPSSSRSTTSASRSPRSWSASRRSPIPKEIVIVDDCSTDGTREYLRRLEAELAEARRLGTADEKNEIRIFYQEPNQGKGAALRRGFAEATGDIVLVQDADLEYDPRDYPKLLAPDPRGQGRRRLRLPLHRHAAPRPVLLAPRREQVPDARLQHGHEPEPDRHGDGLQGLPRRHHQEHPHPVEPLRRGARAHREARQGARPDLRGPDLLRRPRLLGRQEDPLDGRVRRPLDDPALRVRRRPGERRPRLQDPPAPGQGRAVQPLDARAAGPLAGPARPRDRLRDRELHPLPGRPRARRGHRRSTRGTSASSGTPSSGTPGWRWSRWTSWPSIPAPLAERGPRHHPLPQRPRARRGRPRARSGGCTRPWPRGAGCCCWSPPTRGSTARSTGPSTTTAATSRPGSSRSSRKPAFGWSTRSSSTAWASSAGT